MRDAMRDAISGDSHKSSVNMRRNQWGHSWPLYTRRAAAIRGNQRQSVAISGGAPHHYILVEQRQDIFESQQSTPVTLRDARVLG